MVRRGTRLIIIGKDQVYTDMPGCRNHHNPEYRNERVRGTGGFDVANFGEENLLDLLIDRDASLYALIDERMAYKEHVDWRYQWPMSSELGGCRNSLVPHRRPGR